MHDGLDIGILRSLDVVAAASGLVTQTGYLAGYEGYGNVVVVQVDDGVEMLYAHLSRVDVRAGEWLPVARRSGWPDARGRTGTHLHFEVRREGVPIDPLLVLGVPDVQF